MLPLSAYREAINLDEPFPAPIDDPRSDVDLLRIALGGLPERRYPDITPDHAIFTDKGLAFALRYELVLRSPGPFDETSPNPSTSSWPAIRRGWGARPAPTSCASRRCCPARTTARRATSRCGAGTCASWSPTPWSTRRCPISWGARTPCTPASITTSKARAARGSATTAPSSTTSRATTTKWATPRSRAGTAFPPSTCCTPSARIWRTAG